MPNDGLYINYNHQDADLRNIGAFLQDRTSLAYGMTLTELMSYTYLSQYDNCDDQGNCIDSDDWWVNNYISWLISLTLADKLWIQKCLGEEETLKAFNKKFIDDSGEYENIADGSIIDDLQSGVLSYDTLFGDDLSIYTLNIGCFLKLPISSLNKQNAYIRGSGFVRTDYVSTMLDDAAYQAYIDSNKITAESFTEGGTRYIVPQLSVLLWSKAFGEDVIFDITDFITSCSTNVNKDGGTFEIAIAPIIGEYNEEKKCWEVKRDSIYRHGQKGYAAYSSMHSNKKGKLRPTYLFSTALQSNDLIFIRYEALDIEKKRLQEPTDYIKDKTILSEKVFDMIGLVDSVSDNITAGNNDIAITISGRDLMKLVTDDGSYFYPLQFAGGKIVAGDTSKSFITRLCATGRLALNAMYSMRSISYSMSLIFVALANSRIVPDSLFEGYTYTYSYSKEQKANGTGTDYDQWVTTIREGINKTLADIDYSELKQKAIDEDLAKQKEYITLAVNRMALAYNTASETETTEEKNNYYTEKAIKWAEDNPDILSITQVLKLEGGALTKLVECFEGEYFYTVDSFNATYANYDNFTESELFDWDRQIEGLKSVAEKAATYVKLKNSSAESSQMEYKPAKGIWQIVNIVMDLNLIDLRVMDPSISYPDGALVEYVRKLCQEPFVEFWGDTLGNSYNFIVRQPPFNQESLIRVLEKEQYITIKDEDIFQMNLSFNDTEIYTWFEIQPKGYFNNYGSESATPQLPIVQFEKMVDIWGSRRLKVVHQYLSYSKMMYRGDTETSNHLLTQGIDDLKYIIDCHIYLPFTRQGQITINGDRRIKRGTFIRLNATNELYHVDSVQNNMNISGSGVDRTTILNVSRGMIVPYIAGVVEDGIKETVGYFNIVNTNIVRSFLRTGLMIDPSKQEESIADRIKKDFAMNEDVFNFFLKRRDKADPEKGFVIVVTGQE